MAKYNVVLRKNPGKKKGAKPVKVRTIKQVSSKKAAQSLARSLNAHTKKGVSIGVETVGAAAKAAAKVKTVKAKPRKASRRTTGPSRGLHSGAVSNPSKTRKFDGKVFVCKKTCSKAEALKSQKYWKARGHNARITKEGSKSCVWVSRAKAKK